MLMKYSKTTFGKEQVEGSAGAGIKFIIANFPFMY